MSTLWPPSAESLLLQGAAAMVFDLCDPQPDATWSSVNLKPAFKGSYDPETASEHQNGSEAFLCNYDENCSELYKKIELEKWEEVIDFLDTGDWATTLFFPDFSPEVQAKTLVARFDKKDPTKIKWKQSPLHLAIICGAPFSVIRRLVDLNPHGVRWVDDQHNLPIHLALLYKASDDTVAYLLLQFPDSVNVQGKYGHTPVEYALRAKDKLRGKILEAFITNRDQQATFESKKYDGAPECNYEKNCTVLYRRIEGEQWEAIIEFLDTGLWPTIWLFPIHVGLSPAQSAMTWVTKFDPNNGTSIRWSQLPLHLALVCGAPFSVVRRLVEVYPAALRYADDRGLLPIHLALYHDASDDILAYLLLKFPDSLHRRAPTDRSPIDCALRGHNKVRGKILQIFVNKYKTKTDTEAENRQKKIEAVNRLKLLKKALEASNKKKEEEKARKTEPEGACKKNEAVGVDNTDVIEAARREKGTEGAAKKKEEVDEAEKKNVDEAKKTKVLDKTADKKERRKATNKKDTPKKKRKEAEGAVKKQEEVDEAEKKNVDEAKKTKVLDKTADKKERHKATNKKDTPKKKRKEAEGAARKNKQVDEAEKKNVDEAKKTKVLDKPDKKERQRAANKKELNEPKKKRKEAEIEVKKKKEVDETEKKNLDETKKTKVLDHAAHKEELDEAAKMKHVDEPKQKKEVDKPKKNKESGTKKKTEKSKKKKLEKASKNKQPEAANENKRENEAGRKGNATEDAPCAGEEEELDGFSKAIEDLVGKNEKSAKTEYDAERNVLSNEEMAEEKKSTKQVAADV